MRVALEARLQGVGHLANHVGQVEQAPLFAGLVGGHLFKVSHQLHGAVQVALYQLATLQHLLQERCQFGRRIWPRSRLS